MFSGHQRHRSYPTNKHSLLISGAQRMREAMEAQGQAAGNQCHGMFAQDDLALNPQDDTSQHEVGMGPEITGSVVQVKSRQGTLDFSEDVQTILDTGEIKLVKATQKTTGEMETQTDFTPMWFFGFDPTATQTPTTVTTPEGTVVTVPKDAQVHSIPAVDLSRFEQFSVIHYSDTRDPENRKLVMIQTPGSKMHKPEELCTEDMSVQNKPTLNVPFTKRQLLDRKSKSLDNSALMTQTSSKNDYHQHHENKPVSHENILKRQDRVVEGKIESSDEGTSSHDGDASLQDPDIDSGIWDVVRGRDARLNSRDTTTSPNVMMTSSPSTSSSKYNLQEAEDPKGDVCQGDDVAMGESSVEASATWQEMYKQMGLSDKERPTMSYRVFHIQDQVAPNTLDNEEEPRPESPVSNQSISPQLVQASTPRLEVKQLCCAEQLEIDHRERLTEQIEQLADQHEHEAEQLSEPSKEDSDMSTTNDSLQGEVFSDELFPPGELTEAEEGKHEIEDSGWLFDKIPAMQGSLIHSPASPSSPNTFPPRSLTPDCTTGEDRGEDVTPTGTDGDVTFDVTQDNIKTAVHHDATPIEEELCMAQQTFPLKAAVIPEHGIADGLLTAPTHPELPNRDSQESTDTVTEERIEDQMAQLEEMPNEVSNMSLCTTAISEAPEVAVTDSDLTMADNAGFDHILFDEQEAAVEASSPSSGTVEESMVDLSQSSTTNGEVYESCNEGDDDDLHVTMEMVVQETVTTETVTITTTTSTPENSRPGSRQGTVIRDPVQKVLTSVDRSVLHRPRKNLPSPLQSPITPSSSSQLQSPLPKSSSPLACKFVVSGSGGGEVLPTEPRGCVVHRSGARPKLKAMSPRHGPSYAATTTGLGSLFSDETVGTLISAQSPQSHTSHVPDEVYLVNRDGTLTNATSGVIYHSGARLKSTPSGRDMSYGSGHHESQGLNSFMVRSTSSNVVHSHVVTELTAARARLKLPELRRTPDRHSVASSDSEYTSLNSSLTTSPTSTSVEELASVGSDTCLLAEVMPVAYYPDWMGSLPKRLHAVPLTKLAIPGSNISFAIESEMRTDMSFSKCNLEMAEFLRKLPPLAIFDNFRKIMKDIWRAWMPKQILSVAKQLEAGVRYLDIHITRYRGTFYGEHGLYTRSLKHYLRHVDEFILQHPREVIILHFQKLTGLGLKDKRTLVTLLFQFFGAKLCREMDTANVTLEELWTNKKQIIAVFPDVDIPALSNHIFAGLIWSSKIIRSSLPRKQTTQELVTYLESVYDEHREPHEFHALQAVVSPDMNMVFGDYLHKSMRSLTLCDTSPYLKVWLPGKANLNIVTVDFVGIYDLTGEIIRLNDDKKAETIV